MPHDEDTVLEQARLCRSDDRLGCRGSGTRISAFSLARDLKSVADPGVARFDKRIDASVLNTPDARDAILVWVKDFDDKRGLRYKESKAGNEELDHMKLCIERNVPKCARSMIDRAVLDQVKDLMDGGTSGCTESDADKEETKSVRAMPDNDATSSRQPGLLNINSSSKCKRSSVREGASRCTGLLTNVSMPVCVGSNTGREKIKPRCARPHNESTRPACAKLLADEESFR